MRIMLPTAQLRWNERLDTKQCRLELLWVEQPAAPTMGGIPVLGKEWRPLQLIKVGWANNKYDDPLPIIHE